MYEFEIDCLILTITCDILILTERGNYLKFSSLPVQVVHVVAVPLMKKTERGERERDTDTDSLEDRIDSIEKSAKVKRVKDCNKMKVAKGKVTYI